MLINTTAAIILQCTHVSTTKSDWLYTLQPKMEKLYTVSKSGSDHEILIEKFRLKLKEVGKTTRPIIYDLIQIFYDYTVEATNRFKGLDLIECRKNHGRRFGTLYRRQESRPSPRNAKKQNGCPRRLYKQLWKEDKRKAKEKRKDIPIWKQSSKE